MTTTAHSDAQAPTPEARYSLRSGLHVLPYGSDEIFVRTGSRAAFSKVIRDDGRRQLLTSLVAATTTPGTAADFAATMHADVDDVQNLLTVLHDEGVVAVKPEHPVPLNAILVGSGLIADRIAANLADVDEVTITAVALDDDGMPDLEDAANADSAKALSDADLIIVATDSLRPRLNRVVDSLAHDARVRVIYVFADGPEIQIGPLVTPGEGACYVCFEIQDEGARHLRDDFLVFKTHLENATDLGTVDPVTAAVGASWAALAVRRLVGASTSFLTERVVRIETDRLEIASHRVLQLPRCPACSRHRAELQHTFL